MILISFLSVDMNICRVDILLMLCMVLDRCCYCVLFNYKIQ